jgi:benzoyl-CoA reductase/2-hydroxyglutaryl-CoA dehydratase subunit BcrC/BadD/HgdB
MTSTLPSSDALAEASLDSLQELMARDPESYQQQFLDRVIEEIRKLRERLEAAEAAGTKPRAARVAKPAISTPINPTDFGI